ncbi:putative oxalocrotonate tautomerase [Ampelomyces quisqualis]|uniref:Putative oxalocrotonate tautomerase n=1 Tax=Ampelomyces quisqualis TaxID=50730 RepID=A0A6A5R203_AMPQU|nr:putative oxalocrotonate tautomerase [Ampelomyces quisqualis]
MPLWIIYHPPSAFTSPETKRSLANEITKIYTGVGLPPFYVNVFFRPMEPADCFVGGEERPSSEKPSFIRLTMEHIARTFPNKEAADKFMGRVDEVLKPYIADQGFDWEYSILETSRDLWKVNGLVPPMTGTKAEQMWFKENKPLEFEKADGGLA